MNKLFIEYIQSKDLYTPYTFGFVWKEKRLEDMLENKYY